MIYNDSFSLYPKVPVCARRLVCMQHSPESNLYDWVKYQNQMYVLWYVRICIYAFSRVTVHV